MSARLPLRDRCNVPTSVCTDPKNSKFRAKNPLSSAGNTPLPSARQSRRRLPLSPPPALPSHEGSTITLPPLDGDGARQFIPYLYLFSPSSADELPAGNWTHIVRLLPATLTQSAESVKLISGVHGGGGHGLNLYCSASQATNLPLSAKHLLLARDFLGLALPYYASAHPAVPSPASSRSSSAVSPPVDDFTAPSRTEASQADVVQALVVGEPRAALAIALTYVAYASDSPVAHVMRCVLEEEEDEEWCRLLGPDGQMGLGSGEIEVMDRIAMKGI